MIKINIFKSQYSFSVIIQLTTDYKDAVKTMDGIFLNSIDHKLVIPIKYYDQYITLVKQYLGSVKIRVFDSYSYDYLTDFDTDEEEDIQTKRNKSEINEILIVYKDDFLLIPMEQEKKLANEIILSFKDYEIDIDLWMWKIPLKHKNKFFECLITKNFFINEYL